MDSLKDLFDQQGYLIIEDMATAAQCDQLMEQAMLLANDYQQSDRFSIFQTENQSQTTDDYFLNSGDQIALFFEKDAFNEQGKFKSDLFHSLNKIGHALHDLDPVFESFSRNEKNKELAASLGLANHVLIQSMFIFKHAKIGGEVDVHQDSTFLYTEPESCVGFWFALEDATIENGCLWAEPGGHRTALRKIFTRKACGGTTMKILDPMPYDLSNMIPLEVKKGTCIVLNGLLPHYSQPNTSGHSRQAYAIHTIDPQAHYPSSNWLQRDAGSLRPF
ncbi:MAG: phytanoyl-CoA dioxygenase family protein [Ferruginibacter sp.]